MEDEVSFLTSSVILTLLAGSLIVWAQIAGRLAMRPRTPLVEYEPRLPVPWSGVDVAVLGATALMLQSLVVGLVVRWLGIELNVRSPEVLEAIIVSRLAWLAFAIPYLVFRTGAYADDMGFDLRRFGHDMRVAGLTFLAAIVPVYGTQIVLTQVFGIKSEHALVQLARDAPNTGLLVLISFAAVIMAPLVEEFLVRVVLQGWLEKKQRLFRKRRGDETESPAGWGPIVVSGAIFAVLHEWPDSIALFILSLFLGYAYQRTHRIVAPLTVHVLVNSLAMLELWREFFAATS
jgi:membrane protease YdiL (CAAX protease family)